MIKVMPCNCFTEDAARYIPQTAFIDSIWPEVGLYRAGAISIDGVCYSAMSRANIRNTPPALILDPTDAVVFPSCRESPCSEQSPCPPCSNGGAWINGSDDDFSCSYLDDLFCVARITTTVQIYAWRNDYANDQLIHKEVLSVSHSATFEAVGGVLTPVSASTIAQDNKETWLGSGVRDTTTTGRRDWSLDDYIDAGEFPISPGFWVGFRPRTFATWRMEWESFEHLTGSTFSGVGNFTIQASLTGIANDDNQCTGSAILQAGTEFETEHIWGSGWNNGGGTVTTSEKGYNYREPGSGSDRTDRGYRISVSISTQSVEPNGTIPPVATLCTDPRLAVACDPEHEPNELIYDKNAAPEWAVGLTLAFQSEQYILTEKPATEPDEYERVFFNTGTCPDADDTYLKAYHCSTNAEISYDPATLSGTFNTLVYLGEQYTPTNEPTTEPPVVVTPSIDPCPSLGDCSEIHSWLNPKCRTPAYRHCPRCSPFLGCGDIVSPEDSRCGLPQWAHCPQCFAGSPVDPPIGPNQLLFPDDAPPDPPDDLKIGVFEWGSMIRRAIELFRLHKLAPRDCAGCKRRELLINEFGERIGAAIADYFRIR